jgi:hypothetical protein
VLSRSLAGLTPLVLAAALTLLGLNVHLMAGWLGFEAILAGAALLYAGTGWLITRRLPGNAIGWLLGVIGLLVAAEMLTEQYTIYGLVTAPGSVPGPDLVGWFCTVMIELALFLLLFLLVLFPDGRLPSRRWRPVLWAILAAMAGSVTGQMQAGRISAGPTDVLDRTGHSYPNPVGILPHHGWISGLLAVADGLIVVAAVLSVASVFARRRGANTERRKQLAWLGWVGLLTVCRLAATGVCNAVTHGANGWIADLLYYLLVLTPLAGIPLACAVAVLKYRLYDIDRLISRTVAYVIVTGLLVGLYAGLVLLATDVLPLHGPVAVAGSTLVVAAVFNPLRVRVQRLVDRRFNRSRYNAELMIAAFAARLQDATDLDAIRSDLAATLDRALEPVHLSLWSGQRKRPRSAKARNDGRSACKCTPYNWLHPPAAPTPGAGAFAELGAQRDQRHTHHPGQHPGNRRGNPADPARPAASRASLRTTAPARVSIADP